MGLIFSVEDGIKVQRQQLDAWKMVLTPSAYEALEAFATKDNDKATKGYEICRGTDMDCFISNYSMKLLREKK